MDCLVRHFTVCSDSFLFIDLNVAIFPASNSKCYKVLKTMALKVPRAHFFLRKPGI